MVFSVQIDYKVLPSNIALPSQPGETIQPYTRDIQGEVTIARPGEPVVNSATNTVSLSYKTDSKLSGASKYVSSTSVYDQWPSTWGPEPAGEENDKYFYVVWHMYHYLPSTNTQPFTISTTDVIPADGGQVVGWGSFSKPTLANFEDGWDNNLEEYNRDTASSIRIATPSTSGYGRTTYLHMRYPRSLLQHNAATDAMEYRVTNTMRDELIGDYGATDFKEATGSFWYREKSWTPVAGSYISKRAYGPSPGMITRLEDAWLAGSTDPLSLHAGTVYTWYVSSSQTDWARTLDQNGVYGQVAWTAVHQDNQFSFDATYTTSANYLRLQKGDYALTTLTLYQPTEHIYGEPTAQGTNQPILQVADQYGTVTVQVTTVDNPTEADWRTIGVSTMKPVQNTGWIYTPADGGAPVDMRYGSVHAIDLTQVVPDAEVLGVRMLQTTKAATAAQGYTLRMHLYPTNRVIDGLRPPPTRTGDIRSTARLYNLATSQATGGSVANDGALRAVSGGLDLTRQTYTSSHSKYAGAGIVDRTNKLVRFTYTLHAYNDTPFPAGTTEADAVAMNLLTEQKTGIFYDLLPPGTTLDLSSIEATTYRGGGFSNAYRVEHAVQVIDNFKNTGRSMLIVSCTTPETLSNYYGYTANNQLMLRSGYSLRFNVINTFDNLLDNPKSGRNYSAYESVVGPLGAGLADMPPSNFTEEAAKTAFTNVNGKDEPDNRRFMYAYADWRTDPPMSKQLGFDKLVKTPEDAGYTKETVVQGGGQFTYRLRLANEPNTSARNLVFYDSMEDRAPADAPEFWTGTLESVDLSQPRLTWGLEPVVYYATRHVNPKDVLADRLVLNGQMNTTLWTKLDLTQSYPADLKAIAVDMRYLPSGEPFVLPPERSLVVLLSMRAPGDVSPYVDPIDYAWNSAFLGSQPERAGVISEYAVVDVTPTKVSLKPVDLEVTKSSYPASGSADTPTVALEGNTITYTFAVRNTNGAEAIPGVVLEDQIPEGLTINTANIRYRFGYAAYQLVNTAQRITMSQEGQKLLFSIDQLAAGERVEFQVTTTVNKPTQAGTIKHENTARVTRALGFDQNIASPTTYHETPVAIAEVPFRKLLDAGGRVPKAGEFQVEVTDTNRNRVAGPFFNSGASPYNFDITLHYGRPGYYYYYVREIKPDVLEEGMTYSGVEFYVTVYVYYNSITRALTVNTVSIRLNSVVQTDAKIINTYRATGDYTPAFGKRVFIDDDGVKRYIALSNDQYSVVMVDDTGREQTAYNAMADAADPTQHMFTFAPRHFTEKDIGSTYTFWFKEKLGTQDSIQYDERTIRLELTVVDNGGGKLGFEEKYFEDDGDPATQDPAANSLFENQYLTTAFTIEKLWRVPNAPGYSPEDIPGWITAQVQLYRDGTPYGDPVTMTFDHKVAEDKIHDWAYTWSDLPRLQAGDPTQASVYTAREVVPLAQFQVTQDGNEITNTYQKGTFTANKIWHDLPDPLPEGYALPTVTLELYQMILPGSYNDPSWDDFIADNWPRALEERTATLRGVKEDPNATGYEVTPWSYQWVGLPINETLTRTVNGEEQSLLVSFEYEVREAALGGDNTDDFFIDTMASASAIVTNVYTKTTFTVTKEWENGPADDRPNVLLQLLQDEKDYGPVVELSSAPVPPATQPPETLTHTWTDLPKYSNQADGTLHVYSVREVLPDPQDPNAEPFPYEPRYSDDGRTIINAYVRPLLNITATKQWQDGPKEDHQEVELQLMRQLQGTTLFEPVAVQPVLTEAIPETGTYHYIWKELPATTVYGRPYTYKVVEITELEGFVTVGENLYKIDTHIDEDTGHTTLTNTYQVPTGSILAGKEWIGGPEQDHQPVEMILTRSTLMNGELVDNQQIPPAQDFPTVTRDASGLWIYEWANAPQTDRYGNPYVYEVQEAGVDDGFVHVNGRQYAVSQEGFFITNTYVQPLTTVTATKVWQGGPADDHTQVELQLYRHQVLDGGPTEPELVLANPSLSDDPLSPIVSQEDAAAPFVYTWADVPATDLLAVPYIYSVLEKGEENGHITVGTADPETPGEEPAPEEPEVPSTPPRLYAVTKASEQTAEGTAITVTNRYIPPLGDIEATKRWVGGAENDHSAVTLDLYRKTADMEAPELVEGEDYQVEAGPAGQFFYKWANLPLTDADAQPYLYSVEEHDAFNGRVTINGRDYGVNVDGLEVTNTFLPPLKTIVCIKNWVGGHTEDHVPVEMEMYRFTEDMPEPFKLASTPDISGEAPTFTYEWKDLPFASMSGQRYTYLIVEKDAGDGLLVINGRFYESVRHPGIDPTRYTNTFLPPTPFTFVPNARKVLEGATLKAEQFSFLLTDHEGAERTVFNKADGTLPLPPVTLYEEGAYTFQLREVQGAESGVTYDKVTYGLTLVLDTNASNALVLASGAWTRNGEPYTADEVQFTNVMVTPEPAVTPKPTAEPKPTYPTLEVPLTASKVLKNGILRAGEFTFVLKDIQSEELSEVKNLQDGTIVFPNRTFSRAVKNYTYTITERKGADTNTTYDDTVYTVKITTTASGGQLQAQVDVLKNGTPYAGDLVFTNQRAVPPTGDRAPQHIMLLLSLAMALGAVAWVLRRKARSAES